MFFPKDTDNRVFQGEIRRDCRADSLYKWNRAVIQELVA